MKKDVLIHVRGLQMIGPEDEQEAIEIVVPGQYYFRNGSHYLRYEEMMDDTAQPTVNYIKMSAQGVEVRKKGQVNVHMVFEQGKKNMLELLMYIPAYFYTYSNISFASSFFVESAIMVTLTFTVLLPKAISIISPTLTSVPALATLPFTMTLPASQASLATVLLLIILDTLRYLSSLISILPGLVD